VPLLHPSTLPGDAEALHHPAEDRAATVETDSQFEECEHIVRDDDVDTALCGVDQTDVPWNQGLPVCEACAAIAQGRMS
jgi:hypothetical protein